LVARSERLQLKRRPTEAQAKEAARAVAPVGAWQELAADLAVVVGEALVVEAQAVAVDAAELAAVAQAEVAAAAPNHATA
jgi:hypothetical protein